METTVNSRAESYMGAWCPRKYIEKFRPDLMEIVDSYEVML